MIIAILSIIMSICLILFMISFYIISVALLFIVPAYLLEFIVFSRNPKPLSRFYIMRLRKYENLLTVNFKDSLFYKQVNSWFDSNSDKTIINPKSIKRLKNNLILLSNMPEVYQKFDCDDYNFDEILQLTMLKHFPDMDDLMNFMEQIYESQEKINQLYFNSKEVSILDRRNIYGLMTFSTGEKNKHFIHNIEAAHKYLDIIHENELSYNASISNYKKLTSILSKYECGENEIPFEWVYEVESLNRLYENK